MSGVTKPYTVANLGNTLAMRIFFFLKMFKIWSRFHKWNKNLKKCFLFLRWLDLNRERQILKIQKRILVMGSPCVNQEPNDLKLQWGRYFPHYFSWQWLKNMVKVLSWRFYLCLKPFNMLTVEGCFETALNSEWLDQALGGRCFRKYISYDDLLFFEKFEIWWRFHKWHKKRRKCFLFLI